MPSPPDSVALRSVQAAFEPLVSLLQAELVNARIPVARRSPRNLGEFTRWYLAVVQQLEQHVADRSGERPMTRDAVELMCRCTLSAGDLREAIALCVRYCDMLYPRGGELSLAETSGRVFLRLDSLRPATTTASSLVDITGLFAFRQLLQWLAGRDLPLRQVSIGPIQRDDVLPFLKLFRAPVLAGGDHYLLEFDAAALDWPCIRSRSEFEAFFAVFPCAVFGPRASDPVAQVSALLVAALERGDRIPTQSDIAGMLEIPLSTLRRRLQDAAVSFRQLREESLTEAATALLERGELPVSAVAARLGFSDAGSFRRAFRRWYGCSPREWQARPLASQAN